MSDERAEIKVGDVGTRYFVPTYDDDVEQTNFDPTTAPVLQIIFRMPGVAALLTRTATASTRSIGGATIFGLEYVVLLADLAAGFHQTPGPVKMEGYVQFGSGQKWASTTITKDYQDRDLKVVARLS